jgi:hypothetical protein
MLAIVQVSSHPRQRHKVVTLMTFARVSTALLLQNGHIVGRVTTWLGRDSYIFAVS